MTGTINETYFEGLEDVSLASTHKAMACKLIIARPSTTSLESMPSHLHIHSSGFRLNLNS